MKKTHNALIWTVALTVALLVSVKTAWADGLSMADIAMEEYWYGVKEDPMGSDAIKYNEWYYGYAVSNQYDQEEDIQDYNWNAVFACWCAEQLGYIDQGRFPLTNNTEMMYQWFLQSGYQIYASYNLFDANGFLIVKVGDILFSRAEDNGGSLKIGIVTSIDSSGIGYILGDVEGTIQLFHFDFSGYDEDELLFPILPPNDDNYQEIVCFLRDRMNLNPAAVCGIAANIMHESNCNPNILGDHGSSYGICQWHLSRWQDLINYCNAAGYDWSSLEGQMMFLRYELDARYQDLKYMLMSCPSSSDGAYQAAYSFCMNYEMPVDACSKADFRACEAKYNVYPYWYG